MPSHPASPSYPASLPARPFTGIIGISGIFQTEPSLPRVQRPVKEEQPPAHRTQVRPSVGFSRALPLNIQILHLGGAGFDEFAALLDLFAHEDGKDPIGFPDVELILGGVLRVLGNAHPQQGPVARGIGVATLLLRFEDHGGDWRSYEEAIYAVFPRDFVASKPLFRGKPVYVERHPFSKGKERGFWHLVQEGPVEEERTPDLRRCERIGWIRTIVEHAGEPAVKTWESRRKNKRRTLLWLEESEFLVVLENRTRA